MKSVGIICEYNPFHNGHLYHLNKIKEMFPNDTIILVMSGNFMQRGEISIINKWDKTDIALSYGVDLVIELPFVFATQSADIFSKGAIEILNNLKVHKIVFGSECGDINVLKTLANIQLNNKKYDNLVKKYLDEGINYPSAMSKALLNFCDYKIDAPNDILGLSYVKEIIKQNSNIEPICIKRTNKYHDLNLDNEIISASAIRNALKENKDISKFVPKETLKYLNNTTTNKYFDLLKYKIISCNNLNIYQTVDEGIEYRIKNYILKSNTLEELINYVKTKRYTYNKLNRMFTHILCDFTKEQANILKNIEYIRVLGFNNNGKRYLNKIKKETSIPIITNFSSIKNEMLDLEFKSTCVYSCTITGNKQKQMIESEYKNKPIMKD